MSSLVVTSRVAALIPTAGKDERLQEFLPAPPTTLRDFGIGRYAGVLRGNVRGFRPRQDHPCRCRRLSRTNRAASWGLSVTCRRCLRHGRVLARRCYSSSIPLTNLRPGAYVLRVGTRASAGATSATRQLAFRVWPPPESQSGDSPADPIVAVAAGVVSGVRDLETVVARTSSEWVALWSRLPLKRTAPTVTFDSTMVVAVFLGREAHRRLRRSHCRHQAGGRYTGGGVHGAEPAANRGQPAGGNDAVRRGRSEAS